MIICYRRIGKAVELGKAVHILPYLFVVCMENMGAVFVNMDPFHLLCINISCDSRTFIDYQDAFSCRLRLMCKYCSEETCTDNKKVIFVFSHIIHPYI